MAWWCRDRQLHKENEFHIFRFRFLFFFVCFACMIKTSYLTLTALNGLWPDHNAIKTSDA